MNQINVTYHGHACFVIAHDDKSVIIDPWLSNNPLATIAPRDVQCNAILVTHGHFDHLGNAIEISAEKNIKIYAISELASYCEMKGAFIEKMNMGGWTQFSWGSIKFTPAWHSSSGRENDQIIYTGMPAGILLKMGGKTIYHAGDTGLFGDMQVIGALESVDLALLPIGGRYVMDVRDAAIAASWLKASKVIPMHYNTFKGIEQDPLEFKALAEEQAYDVMILESGASCNI